MTAVIPAIGEALLHIRHLQRDLAKSLQQNNHNWDKTCQISQWAKSEIQWWKTFLIKKNGLPIQQVQLPEPSATIYVDASDVGWGVSSKIIETSGFWSCEDKEKSINVRELKAIYYAVLMHAKRLSNTALHIYSDNKTALKYVTKAGEQHLSTFKIWR
jgi:hypothetical protein